MTDVRTIKQNRHLYWLFGKLGLKEAVPELVMQFTDNRTTHTSEMDFIECMNLIRYLEQFLRKPQEYPRRNSAANIDRHRKGVLKAIFEWGRLGGFEWDEEYVKGIACRAAGCDSFNDIHDGDLVRIYNEFCRKQSVAKAKAGSRKSEPNSQTF